MRGITTGFRGGYWLVGPIRALAILALLVWGGDWVPPAFAEEDEEAALTEEEMESEDKEAEEEEDDKGQKDGALETFTPQPDLATLYVAREKKFKGSAIKKKIYFNGEYAGKIGNGKYAVFHLPPGEYVIGVLEKSDKRSLAMNLEAGKVYYAQLRIKFGIAKARGKMEPLSEKDGQALVHDLNKAKDEDLVK